VIPEAIREGDEDTEKSPAPSLLAQPLTSARERGVDLVLLAAVLALLAIGAVEIYSASAVNAGASMGSPSYFLVRHLFYLSVGLCAMWFGATVDHGRLRRWALPLLGLSFALLIAVLLAGAHVNGAQRWFRLGPLSFQPVEVAKLGLVLYLATSLAHKQEKMRTFTVGFVPHMVVCAAMMTLLLKQPDLGSSLVLGATTLIMLFVAGTKVSYILLAVLAAAPIVYQAVVGTPWRMQRMIAFLDPWQFREGVGYQITESLISVGSGGLTGLGLGDGKQKLFYMPEAHSDFIMSNVGEELGFVGFALVLLLYVVILWRGARAALGARDTFGTYLSIGLVSIFTLQALINTAVVLGAIPAKGLTLPFMSYGGTSLIVCMYFAGLLLNISRRTPEPARDLGRRLSRPSLANRRKRRQVVVVTQAS
jgi:cell division protein FtsW